MKNQINLSFSEMQPVTLQGNKSLMSAELAHQKADKHLCVALHRKVRIRLHPSIETNCGITNILDGSLPNVASITLIP